MRKIKVLRFVDAILLIINLACLAMGTVLRLPASDMIYMSGNLVVVVISNIVVWTC